MEVKEISSEEMNSKGNNDNEVPEMDIRSERFKRTTTTGRYEIIDNERYEVHECYDEKKCFNDTAPTEKIVHVIEPEDKSSFWLSLCPEHLKEIEIDTRLDILEKREPIRGE